MSLNKLIWCFSRGNEAYNDEDTLLPSMNKWNESPKILFECLMAALILVNVILKILGYIAGCYRNKVGPQFRLKEEKPEAIKSLERIYLPVFWLFRLAFWMSGPFFYAVYASKCFDGECASGNIIRNIFLVGFISAAFLLPLAGRSIDQFGRMKGTMVAAVTYGLGALSTQSSSLVLLMAGRGLGVLGTGLMTSIPEAWLASATKETKADPNGRWLRKIFASAYSFDYIVAICAGQLASHVSESHGPTAPFKLSPLFLGSAVLIVLCYWKENSGFQKDSKVAANNRPSLRDGINVIMSDSKVLFVGCIQSLFDAAMYIFVMQWAPAMSAAASTYFNETDAIPFGAIFSCFMACCLIGSSLHVELTGWAFSTECLATMMLAIASLSLASVAYLLSGNTGFFELVVAFFVFEVCVGMYFPSISWLRSKYIPVNNRSAVTTLFSTVFIAINVCINLSITKIGIVGAWSIAASAIGLACICLIRLQMIVGQDESKEDCPLSIVINATDKKEALGGILGTNGLVKQLNQRQKVHKNHELICKITQAKMIPLRRVLSARLLNDVIIEKKRAAA